MKWLLLIASIPILLILVMVVIGLLLPVKHSVTKFISLKQNPETVFALLDKSEDLPQWSSGITKVEPLPDRNGRPAIRCTLKWGGKQMIMTQLERTPPNRLVTSMGKENGPNFGTWTYQITADNGGCRLELTEDGELQNPLFRIMARMRGLDANITQTLQDVAKKFGGSASIGSAR